MKHVVAILCLLVVTLVACTTNEPDLYDGLENGQSYMDLGLNVCWATHNLGAQYAKDYGKYYAWGETSAKTIYLWFNYPYGSAYNKLTKYCSLPDFGKQDNLNLLDANDDAASMEWKGTWRMPTNADWVELLTKCQWKYIDEDNKCGYEVTGPNGHSIFMPMAGFKDSTEVYTSGINGYYWSSSLYTPEPDYAFGFYMNAASFERYHDYRYLGLSIRPVCKPANNN